MMKFENVLTNLNRQFDQVIHVFSQANTYHQLGLIVMIYGVAYLLASMLRKQINTLQVLQPSYLHQQIVDFVSRAEKLIFPIIAISLLKISAANSEYIVENGWALNVAVAIATMLLFNSFINLFVSHGLAALFFRWIGLPILFFHLVGFLDDLINMLNAMSIDVGNIKITAYGLIRTLIFGSLLFWLGRVSNQTGQTIIRKQETLDVKSRELFAKLYEMILFVVILILLLELIGINLTALAVFGGAVGVGLGFGLQAIASNFISGVIIILDKSVAVGDHVEMEDGKSGLVTQLNMRSTTLETFDGKDIVIPNEKFITGTFINWTHKNKKQRYRVDFSVAYNTNVRSMVELIKQAVATHPQVLSGEDCPIEERPDCEIDSFGDNGINMFVEFWMEGIDDGKNRVGGDLYLIILETLQANGIEIPFPQREVRIINEDQSSTLGKN